MRAAGSGRDKRKKGRKEKEGRERKKVKKEEEESETNTENLDGNGWKGKQEKAGGRKERKRERFGLHVGRRLEMRGAGTDGGQAVAGSPLQRRTPGPRCRGGPRVPAAASEILNIAGAPSGRGAGYRVHSM